MRNGDGGGAEGRKEGANQDWILSSAASVRPTTEVNSAEDEGECARRFRKCSASLLHDLHKGTSRVAVMPRDISQLRVNLARRGPLAEYVI